MTHHLGSRRVIINFLLPSLLFEARQSKSVQKAFKSLSLGTVYWVAIRKSGPELNRAMLEAMVKALEIKK